LISDSRGWHCQQLHATLNAYHCKTQRVALSDCCITTEGAVRIQLPGFENDLPDAVFVRGVPGGTLETVVFYLDILHGLQQQGVHVYNTARMIERSVDKAMTTLLLKNAGLATPPTWVTVDYRQACAIVESLSANNQAAVLKPLFGSQGKDVRLLREVADLPSADEQSSVSQSGVYYLQQFVDSDKPYDWRVFVVGEQVVAAMQRHGRSWVHNAAQGAECCAAAVSDEIAELARRAVRAVGLFYGGVDLIVGSDQTPQVIEINSIPAWKSLQAVSAVNIAAYLLDHFMASYYSGLSDRSGSS